MSRVCGNSLHRLCHCARSFNPSTDARPPAETQVICERADKTDIPAIDKKKYLVPADLTVGQVRSPSTKRTNDDARADSAARFLRLCHPIWRTATHQFVYVIRKRIKLQPEKAIFIFVDEVLPPTAALMSSIYEEHKCVRPPRRATLVC